VSGSLTFGAWERESAAQDFGIGPQKETTLTTSRVGVETAWASFDQQGVQGDYFGVTVRGDLKLAKNVGLRLLVPMYEIQLAGQSANLGFGDAELRVRILIFEGHPWRLYGGLADQLPTGDTAAGLGQGGSQLSPFLTGGWRNGHVVVYASIADCIGLHPKPGPGKPAPNDYVDPSYDHELRANLGLIGEVSDSFYLSAALTGITDLDPGNAGTSLLSGGLALGYLVSESFKVVMFGLAPFAGEHRFDEKIGLNAYLYF
jgi:hypothetical protein